MQRLRVIKRGEKITALILSVFFLLFYVFFQSPSIYGGDAGDLVSAAFVRGVAHPPGYPLYTFLGWLQTQIPLGTVAWRVGFLSSIPMALSLGLFFILLIKLVRRPLVALIATLSLGFNYLVWLYAIVPEVFALNLLFSVGLTLLAVVYSEQRRTRLLYLMSFIFGLALSHHQTILFLVPGWGWLVYRNFLQEKNKGRILLISCLIFIAGLLPYLYVVWAALGRPYINWENPVTGPAFIRLVTRAVYGTFRAGQMFGLNLIDRYFQLRFLGETLLIDFTKIGVILGVIGIVEHYREHKQTFWPFVMSFLLAGPGFLFYAAFPIYLNFHLGTSERFLLIPYFLLSIWIAFGIAAVAKLVERMINRLVHKRTILSATLVMGVLPLAMLYTNYAKLGSLRFDATAENLAQDILDTAPDNSLLFLADDTSIFDTQYLYLTQGKTKGFRGLKLIQTGTLSFPSYLQVLAYQYPELEVGTWEKNTNVFDEMVKRYYGTYPLLSTMPLTTGKDFAWIQTGILYRLYKIEEIKNMQINEFIVLNEQLFQSYHDPLQGSLGNYKHPMLADVLRVYATSKKEFAKVVFANQKLDLAEKYLKGALELEPELIDTAQILGAVYIAEKKCPEAESLLLASAQRFNNQPETYRLLALLYKDCFGDEAKASVYENEYQKKLKNDETDLNKF